MVLLMTVDHKLEAWHFWRDIGCHLLEILEPYSVTTDRAEQTDPVTHDLDSCPNARKRKPRTKRAKRVPKKNVLSKNCKTVIESVDNENNDAHESDSENIQLQESEITLHVASSDGQIYDTRLYEQTESSDRSMKNRSTGDTDCITVHKQIGDAINIGSACMLTVNVENNENASSSEMQATKRSSNRIAENNITPMKDDWIVSNVSESGFDVMQTLDQMEATSGNPHIINAHHNYQMSAKSANTPDKHKTRKKRSGKLPDNPKCSQCGLVLANVHNLFVHLRSHNDERPFSCAVCLKTFHTKGNMMRHEKTHSGGKPYICSICSKGFTEKRSLKVHQRCHTGEKPYVCSECGKRFSQSGVLAHHMATHTGIRPYLCNQCGREFAQKSQLKTHESRHANEKPYICDHPSCTFSFVSKGELVRHKTRHTRHRPHLCTQCPKSFSRLQYLKAHMNHHNGVRPYVCKICEETFFDVSALSKHRIAKHTQEVEQPNEVSSSVSTLQTSSEATVYLQETDSSFTNLVPLLIPANQLAHVGKLLTSGAIQIYTQQDDPDESVCETPQGDEIKSESVGTHFVD